MTFGGYSCFTSILISLSGDLNKMINDLASESAKNLEKTKIMTNGNKDPVTVEQAQISYAEEYIISWPTDVSRRQHKKRSSKKNSEQLEKILGTERNNERQKLTHNN